MNDYIFTHGAVTIERISSIISICKAKEGTGAFSIFMGQVRADITEHGVVESIEYTAYEKMALYKASEIKEYIKKKYFLNAVYVLHSLGVVHAGEISLFVLTSGKHRKESIDACSELVERIKIEIPIWGKEIYQNSTYKWKENKPKQ